MFGEPAWIKMISKIDAVLFAESQFLVDPERKLVAGGAAVAHEKPGSLGSRYDPRQTRKIAPANIIRLSKIR